MKKPKARGKVYCLVHGPLHMRFADQSQPLLDFATRLFTRGRKSKPAFAGIFSRRRPDIFFADRHNPPRRYAQYHVRSSRAC